MFIHEDFLLDTAPARELYHRHAEHLPIIDYHCHLPPAEIAQDKRWDNLTQIWLYGDHYKWRAMRAAGVPEKFVTGDASDWEKFLRYAETVPKTLRNPLYHWTHLELARYFRITDHLLGPDTASLIYDLAGAVLRAPGFSCRSLLLRSRVEVVCTTDDPADDLAHHAALAAEGAFPVQVRPTWRPDKALAVDNPAVFGDWILRLEHAAATPVRTLDDFLRALRARHDAFAAEGCRLSDRGLDTIYAGDCTERTAAAVFGKARAAQPVNAEEAAAFKSYLLHELAVMDAEKGWTMQIHLGALRGVNSRLSARLGPDTGFDSIGDANCATALGRHFDRLERIGRLPKTIVYNLNPRDNEVIAAMLGNFQDGSVPGKMQFGSAWWFLDQLDGMTRQLEALSQIGLLSQFVGMLTDSRSFTSYTRHEYFRRLLCRLLGGDIEKGLLPNDTALVGGMVADICYYNARRHFGFYEE